MDKSKLNIIFGTCEEFKDEYESKMLFKQNQALFFQANVFTKQCKKLEVDEKAIDEIMEVETTIMEELKEDQKMVVEELIEALDEEQEANDWKIIGEDTKENLQYEKYKAEVQLEQSLDIEESVIVLQGLKKRIKNCASLELCKYKEMNTQMTKLNKTLELKKANHGKLKLKAIDQTANLDLKRANLQREIDEIDAINHKLETDNQMNVQQANLLMEIGALKDQLEREHAKEKQQEEQRQLKMQEELKLKEELKLMKELKLQQEQALILQKQKEAEEAVVAKLAENAEMAENLLSDSTSSETSLSDVSMTNDKSLEEVSVNQQSSLDLLNFKHPNDFPNLHDLLRNRGGKKKKKKNTAVKSKASTSAGSSSGQKDPAEKDKKGANLARSSRSLFKEKVNSPPMKTPKHPVNVTLKSDKSLQKAVASKFLVPTAARSQPKLASVVPVPEKVLPVVSNESCNPEVERENFEMIDVPMIDVELSFEKFVMEMKTPKSFATVVPLPEEMPVVAQIVPKVKSNTDIATVSQPIIEKSAPPPPPFVNEIPETLQAEPQDFDNENMEIVFVDDDVLIADENEVFLDQQGPIEITTNKNDNESMAVGQQNPEVDSMFDSLDNSCDNDFDDLFKDDKSDSSLLSNDPEKLPSFDDEMGFGNFGDTNFTGGDSTAAGGGFFFD